MLERGISGLPVVDAAGRVVGVISEADLSIRSGRDGVTRARWWLDVLAEGKNLSSELSCAAIPRHQPAGSKVMRNDLITVRRNTRRCAKWRRRSSDENIRRVLVMSEQRLAGIVARRDLVRVLARGKVRRHLAAAPPPGDIGGPMDTIYRGGLDTPAGRRRAWLDSLLVDHGVLRLAWTNAGVVHARAGFTAATTPPRRGSPPWCGAGASAPSSICAATPATARTRCRASGPPARARLHRPADVERPAAVARGPAGAGRGAPHHARAGPRPLQVGRRPRRFRRRGVPAAAGRDAWPARCDQLSLRWGHFARSRAGVLDAFFRAYARERRGGRDFAEWVRDSYDPDAIGAAHAAGRIATVLQDRILRRE